MKQTISKITLITGLLFTNVVKSQEFYTCVPKEDWVKNVSKSSQRSDEEIRNLARQVKRSDEEVKNLARQVRRSDSEIDSIASKYRISDSHIINLIQSNGTGTKCRNYHLYNDREVLKKLTGIIVRYSGTSYICNGLDYFEVGHGHPDRGVDYYTVNISCGHANIIFGKKIDDNLKSNSYIAQVCYF